jgi:hypothetical protein
MSRPRFPQRSGVKPRKVPRHPLLASHDDVRAALNRYLVRVGLPIDEVRKAGRDE